MQVSPVQIRVWPFEKPINDGLFVVCCRYIAEWCLIWGTGWYVLFAGLELMLAGDVMFTWFELLSFAVDIECAVEAFGQCD